MSDPINRAISALESFDPERWERRLSQAEEQAAQAVASWEASPAAARYSPEGRAQEVERLRQPEAREREAVVEEAEQRLDSVATAKALLVLDRGLTATEAKDADEQLARYAARAARLTPGSLAEHVTAAGQLGRTAECWCWAQCAVERLEQLRADLVDAGDNAAARARAQLGIDAIEPVMRAVQQRFAHPEAAKLRSLITEVERSAGRLKGRALAAPMREMLKLKRAQMGYEL
jgi:hypothetical protein